MNFKSSPRTLKWEFVYWGGALTRWYKEGLPKLKGLPGSIVPGDQILGPAVPWGSPSYSNDLLFRDYDVAKFFNFDEQLMLAPYDYWIFPKFEIKVVNEDEKYIEFYDELGIRQKKLQDRTSMALWLEYPVKNRKDWEKIKEERLNINSISKRWNNYIINKYWGKSLDAFIRKVKNRTFPLHCLHGPVGFFGSLRYLFGEKLFLLYYDDPGLIKDVARHLCDLWIMMVEEVTSKIDFDLAGFWEDMCYKNASLISPSIFKEFMSPYYKKLINYIKTKGINLFCVDSDGHLDELIPLFLEVGINIIYPFEQQANNDLIEIRKKYPDLRIWGGINKNEISKSKKHIDKELEKISWLIKQGGYIPFCDHSIPPNVSWENWTYYRNKLNNIIDTTEVTMNK